ncbi:isocitrate dehydrogenase [Candidatus Desantisbacteria bacterium CG_4_10_14_0_8_um_filter_48_22]|uniref:Isocitrate dehydrogenase n=1 Tax=Candidatus Desantisbacteria bacterium CG_4_10_14_0_8_um_filter_48_22 TaxID=1974543 RepID=A0A2M7S9Z8_9BACT|nr:MAG: isocitrate dehydrogenase [Candidatus Desantisbacteria bacterium CG1_02_49_89]PIV56382.1 MAG: isocitrate dehydrogenase [Candidatus Desantisbacteria bacterium CG02_land_8_20_14_3_00_49_13]PIZ16320.1 MAG: isocitrate dehydrogenase [Candidatus Desantisbacteria bacterium CG_4_10_14_0_8_um_filter_48_22]
MYNITLIPGDGVGPEVTDVARKCIEATGVQINWDVHQAGEEALKKYGTLLPETLLQSITKNKVALKGPITTPVGKGFRSVNVELRKLFNLYACVRPCRTYKGVKSLFRDIDLVVIRENTEDLYAGVEFAAGSKEAKEIIQWAEGKIFPDANISVKPISRTGTERIARFAFEYARKNGRKKVTAVTKANIMKFTDGLFLEVSREVAKKYPGILFEERLVDNMCMQLVQKPVQYDVLLLPNLYGDIISDLCAGLVGGLGVAPGANFGENGAIFEAIHGSAPKYKGMNKVDPAALVLSGAMMLEYLGEKEAASKLETAVAGVIEEGKYLTYDFKPDPDDPSAVGTKEMGDAIISKIM